MKKLFILSFSVLIGLLLTVSSHAELIERGCGMIYDTDLNITWLQDTNYANTTGYDDDLYGYDTNGRMTWHDAMTWAENLVYQGYDDWRLPTTPQPDPSCTEQYYPPPVSDGFNCTGCEMGYMYYKNLGNVGYCDAAGNCPQSGYERLPNTGPFNLYPTDYWSATKYIYAPDLVWVFDFGNNQHGGDQYISPADFLGRFAWAVRDGDVVCEEETLGGVICYNGEVYLNGKKLDSLELFKAGLRYKIRTLTDGYVEAKLGEHSVNLDSYSSMTIAETSTSDKVSLVEVYGSLRAKLKHLTGEEHFEIITPQSVIARRGTEVLVEADENESTTIVLEGSVDVSTTDGSESILLHELLGVVVTAAGIGEPFPVSPNKIERWWERMVVSVASPVDLYVTDPLGRHAGMSPSGEIVNEIPGATYNGPYAVPEVVDIPNPAFGSYGIDLLAVGTGSYQLSISGMGMGDDSFFQQHSGSVEFGQIISYQESYQQPGACNVLIDIKPGSFPNAVNPNSKGVIPVAILTTDNFDASTIDRTTVHFGASGYEAEPGHASLEDVDNDIDVDMIFHFSTQNTGILCGDTSAYLTGFTIDGHKIEGYDSITTVGCH